MFYDILRRICADRGTTPTAACKACGLSTSQPTAWKKGTAPRFDSIQALSDYLGVPPSVLLEENDYRPQAPVKVPVLGNVAAGIPIEAITDIEDYEEIPAAMAAGGEYIALRIHGRSMEPRMLEGDVVIVRLQETIESGEIAIVMVNGGDATCKRVRKTESGIMLVPLNPDFEPMFYTAEQVEKLPVRIIGKVVELRGKF